MKRSVVFAMLISAGLLMGSMAIHSAVADCGSCEAGKSQKDKACEVCEKNKEKGGEDCPKCAAKKKKEAHDHDHGHKH